MENAKLTDLTRLLLASPAFNSFVEELSGGNSQATITESEQSFSHTPKLEPQQSNIKKDINPRQAPQPSQGEGNDLEIGMTLLPDNYASSNPADSSWLSNMESDLYDTQVYTLTSMPEGPALQVYAITSIPEGPILDKIDTRLLAGKSSDIVHSCFSDDSKHDLPFMERMPSFLEEAKLDAPYVESQGEIEFDESDPAFALYNDTPRSYLVTPKSPEEQIFGSIQPEKALERIELTLIDDLPETSKVSAATMERFLRLCSSMEAASRRVAAVTSHL